MEKEREMWEIMQMSSMCNPRPCPAMNEIDVLIGENFPMTFPLLLLGYWSVGWLVGFLFGSESRIATNRKSRWKMVIIH